MHNESGIVMVSEELVQRWEDAYRRYIEASKISTVSFAGNADVAREMMMASHNVATAWHAMESSPDLPWWALAALSTAAQAFDHQAQEWSVRAEGWLGPIRRLSTRPRPTPHRRTDETGEQR
jgi:hypothetical protein